MMMRFRGGGVGHKSTRQATDWFLSDRDKLDEGGGTDTEDEFNDGMNDMEIQCELSDAEMEDTEIKGAEPGFDSDEAEAYEDEIEEYGYDGIEEIEEGDEDEDGDSDDGDAISEVDDAVLGAEDGEDDEDEADDYAEL